MAHLSGNPSRRRVRYRGSILLLSSRQRMLRVVPVVVLIWAMVAWALGWGPA